MLFNCLLELGTSDHDEVGF